MTFHTVLQWVFWWIFTVFFVVSLYSLWLAVLDFIYELGRRDERRN